MLFNVMFNSYQFHSLKVCCFLFLFFCQGVAIHAVAAAVRGDFRTYPKGPEISPSAKQGMDDTP